MAYIETSEDFQDGDFFRCRLQYASFLYDEYRKRPGITNTKALVLAARKAAVAAPALQQFLPAHNDRKRRLRDLHIIDLRASGYSVNLIAESVGVSRKTVGRVLAAHADRMAAASGYGAYKIRGRLKYGDPRLNAETMFC